METNSPLGGHAARNQKGQLWQFLPQNDGSFIAPDAEYVSRLYFPLMNSYGMKSSVTPELKGDVVSAFQHYLTAATVTEELHRNVSGRNFWIKVSGQNPWSVVGNSAFQKAKKWTDDSDESEVEGRLGAFLVRRKNRELGLESEVTVFVPETNDFVEIMRVAVKNISEKPITFIPTSATAIFGRHADNFRDHRQVTTMFQKVFVHEHGVRVKPTIVHDEHGHSVNETNYAVFGFEADGIAPMEIWPLIRDFIGEGGSLDNPESVFRNLTAPKHAPETLHGKEAIGAMRYAQKTLNPGETATYIVLHGITDNEDDTKSWQKRFDNEQKISAILQKTLHHWQQVSNSVSFNTADKTFDNWAKWVTFQLKCRQIFGNSYLPDFGYGRGGRGWRDLWQDLLSIFLVDPVSARDEILNNFRGIRVDGSNATIIGTKPGEFIADRNNVPRTWCDHGAWPVFVLDFYIHQTGDFELLFKELPYWKDVFTYRSKNKDSAWESSQGFAQLDENSDTYHGSVIEHILLQQLTAFFNVGDNNNLLLEGGDWNDTLDMARQKGESVCFHNFYAYNLSVLANMLEHLHGRGYETIYLLSEVLLLLDRLPNQQKVDYQSPEAKQTRLERYFHKIEHVVSGSKAQVNIRDLIADLREKSAHIVEHIQKNEWIETSDGYRFFNGHYDNDGLAIHGDSDVGVLMDLTSQVLPIMCNVASEAQISESIRSVKKYLKDPDSPGIRLCTDFKELNLNIGRITGFSYGFKEHGSKWSQQNIMLMYGLYKRGFVTEGAEIFREIYQLSIDSGKSLIFPGIPSYFEPGDRGAYAYLTGSSTWLLLALTTQIFGVDGHYGDLVINPKLDPSFFGRDNTATISRKFRDLHLTVTFKNELRKAFHDFSIGKIRVNGQSALETETANNGTILSYDLLLKWSQNGKCAIVVELE